MHRTGTSTQACDFENFSPGPFTFARKSQIPNFYDPRVTNFNIRSGKGFYMESACLGNHDVDTIKSQEGFDFSAVIRPIRDTLFFRLW